MTTPPLRSKKVRLRSVVGLDRRRNKFKTHQPFIFFSIIFFSLFQSIINKKFHHSILRSSICTSIQVNFYHDFGLRILLYHVFSLIFCFLMYFT
ncbi:hypothetical protein QVD17_06332 [Tagetes erecta]|uniref:Transmembrane protein n=1 Tax=Tagetes erecta TaxID=13708 RepID=A0AAD8LDY2_TARER|nr:hypothetical protein QVD17_06332 [Tagetes erecta]